MASDAKIGMVRLSLSPNGSYNSVSMATTDATKTGYSRSSTVANVQQPMVKHAPKSASEPSATGNGKLRQDGEGYQKQTPTCRFPSQSSQFDGAHLAAKAHADDGSDHVTQNLATRQQTWTAWPKMAWQVGYRGSGWASHKK